MASKPNQNDMVLSYIKEFGSITQGDAYNDLAIMRLPARISELKKQGIPIVSKLEKVKNRFGETRYVARYSIEGN